MALFSSQRAFVSFTFLDWRYNTFVKCVCVLIYSHSIKSSYLLLLTVLKFCKLSKKSIGCFKINGVHKVRVCVVVYSFNSVVFFPESVENSLKPMYSLKYTIICLCFHSENFLTGYSVLGMIILN